MEAKFTVQGGSVKTTFKRASEDIISELGKMPTSILSDCLERMNVMDSGMLPMLEKRVSFSGSAFTVEEMEAGNLMSHLGLKYIISGDILVIDGKGVKTRAGWGGVQTFAAKIKGVKAIIIDGAIRDWDDVQKFGIPVYARALTPAGPHKGWGGRANEPVSCGSVVVNPGDIIVGDADGITVVPQARASEILAAAKAKL